MLLNALVADYSPAKVNLANIVPGDDAVVTLVVNYSDGAPFDMSSASVVAKVKDAKGVVIGVFDNSSGITVDVNQLTWLLPKTFTALLKECKSYSFDLKVEKDGLLRTLLAGLFIVNN